MDSGFSAEAQVGMNAAAGRYEAEAEYKKEIARLTEELADARKKPEPVPNWNKCHYCGACRMVRPSGKWQYNCHCDDPDQRPKTEPGKP